MRRFKKIKALFLLGIFSILLLHQILPHVHRNETEILSGFTGNHHDDHHDEDIKHGILDILLHGHAHGEGTHTIFIATTITPPNNTGNFTLHPLASFKTYATVQALVCDHTIIYSLPGNHFNPHSSAVFLRGPPVLG